MTLRSHNAEESGDGRIGGANEMLRAQNEPDALDQEEGRDAVLRKRKSNGAFDLPVSRKDAVPPKWQRRHPSCLVSWAVIEVAFCRSARARRTNAGAAFARGHAK
ncbi:hypothetical protein [Pseudotabrizicola algicola]|uniref:Uncharacterized protein n=1 Tax=Pseudotabrizicola algicola TaxID=2709381 RepID=A0A6B3RQY9_9RHOB|nr:hypothetical protein [Pseudotabrizicola algicola]NEX46405.1 hypothetical protein [Pseudotabrizicola algicola]